MSAEDSGTDDQSQLDHATRQARLTIVFGLGIVVTWGLLLVMILVVLV